MASGGCNKRSLVIEHIMLIWFFLCMGMIPFHLCLLDNSGGGSKIEGSCMETERRALLNIRADIYDPDNWLSSWTGQDCCQWRGVGCDNTSGHVVKLNLRYPYSYDVELNLRYSYFYDELYDIGKLPQSSKVNPSISSLMYLRYLDLSMNNFSGAPIPKFIGSLIHLEYLNLSNTLIGGAIPYQIGNLSKLNTLDLGSYWNEFCKNALHANDLQWLSQISSLQYLDLSLVNLSKASNWFHEINMHPSLLVLKLHYTGLPGIPSTLQHVNFTSLTMLDLSENDFQSAIIPGWLLNVSRLVKLELYDCNFHGRLSILVDMLGNLNRLKYLDFSWNQITEDISRSLWNNEHIEHLDLSGNYITGHTIEILGNLSQLRYLFLSGNQISGKISENLGNLSYLNYLDLSGNKISGEIPKSMGNLLNLKELDLSNNRITGWMPEEIFGKHSQLRILYLGGNQISSEILRNLKNLSHLEFLDLSDNKIGGEIPKCMGNLYNLEELHLSNNRITGWTVEKELGNHSKLRSLNLRGNQISSEILQNLRNLSHLEYLDLSDNIISGEIPSSTGNLLNLKELDLSYNQITGWTIEKELGNHSTLRSLNLRGNEISSEILRNLRNLSHLEFLDLSDNKISGEIPKSMGNLYNLEELHLSYNQITGWTVEKELGNHSRLRRLKLEGNQISVEILQNLRNLSHLEFLDLSDNIISGEIPKSMGNLYNLEELDLSNNQITRWMPEEIFKKHSQLGIINLGGNQISGEILQSLRNLSHLEYLDLSDNKMSGEIPNSMGYLLNLEGLDLSYNRITGWIVEKELGNHSKLRSLNLRGNQISSVILQSLRNLSHLEFLDLSDNIISGELPESVGQLSTISMLDLSTNSLTGYVTEVHFSNLTRLDYLDLSYNSLKMSLSDDWIPSFNATAIYLCACHVGPKFPSWLQTQTNLEKLCLSEAGISDKIPPWLWYGDIRYLNVSHNRMEGGIPSSLGIHTYGILDLSSNCFSGPVPNLKADYMFLSSNSFSGPISWSFSGKYPSSPRVLSLSHNHINGSIPHILCNWTFLEVLDLSNNELTGGFPDCWSKSQSGILDVQKNRGEEDTSSMVAYPMYLQSLHMRNNSLSGKFPSFLRLCKRLVILDLGENRFSGNIPTWIGQGLSSLRVLRLRSNFFDGNIPMQISTLYFLRVLDLACNNFSGNLPSSFSNFTAMSELQDGSKPMLSDNFTASYYKESLLIIAKGSELEYTSVLFLVTSIDLSQNNLFGEIPKELTDLRGLRFLNLSWNHFIGEIPQNIGDMRLLESLDLSMNDISGQIPQTMLALNFLSLLNLSYNNLSGRIPSGNQFWTFNDPSIYIGNHDLCGQPLPDCPTDAPPHQEDGGEVDKEDYDMIGIYATSALGFILGFWGFLGTMMIKKDIRISYLRFIDGICDWVYTELAIKFAKLKFVIGRSNHKHG